MFRLTAVSLLLFSASSDAFSVVPPPAEIVVSLSLPRHPEHLLGSAMSSSSQRELLQQSWALGSSTLSLSEATTVPVASTSAAPLVISDISYDGKVPTTESDEYVVLTNVSKSPMDVTGYYVYVATNGSQGATFKFPKDSIIKPGTSVRIYTNEIHKETGGYSFGSGKAIWNNKGGLAVLRNAKGDKMGEFKYKPASS